MSEAKTLVTLTIFVLGFNLLLGWIIIETDLSISCGNFESTFDFQNYTSGNYSAESGHEEVYAQAKEQIDCYNLPYWVWIIDIGAIVGLGYIALKGLPFT